MKECRVNGAGRVREKVLVGGNGVRERGMDSSNNSLHFSS